MGAEPIRDARGRFAKPADGVDCMGFSIAGRQPVRTYPQPITADEVRTIARAEIEIAIREERARISNERLRKLINAHHAANRRKSLWKRLFTGWIATGFQDSTGFHFGEPR